MLNQHRLCKSSLISEFTCLFILEIVKFVQLTLRRECANTYLFVGSIMLQQKEDVILLFTESRVILLNKQEVISLGVLSLLLSVSSQETVGWECFARPLFSCIFRFDIFIYISESTLTMKSQGDFHFSSQATFYESLDCLKNGF